MVVFFWRWRCGEALTHAVGALARGALRRQWLRSRASGRRAAGGCPKHPSWATNPQFQIFPTVEGAAWRCCCSSRSCTWPRHRILVDAGRQQHRPQGHAVQVAHGHQDQVQGGGQGEPHGGLPSGKVVFRTLSWSRPSTPTARPLHADAHLRRGGRPLIPLRSLWRPPPPRLPGPRPIPTPPPRHGPPPRHARRRRHRLPHRSPGRPAGTTGCRRRCPSRAAGAAQATAGHFRGRGSELSEKQERDAAAGRGGGGAGGEQRQAVRGRRLPTLGRLARRRLGARAARDPVAP